MGRKPKKPLSPEQKDYVDNKKNKMIRGTKVIDTFDVSLVNAGERSYTKKKLETRTQKGYTNFPDDKLTATMTTYGDTDYLTALCNTLQGESGEDGETVITADFLAATKRMLSPAEKKDVVSAQETALSVCGFEGFVILWELCLQYAYRTLLPDQTYTDAGDYAANLKPEIWTSNTWYAFLAELKERKFWIPKAMIRTVKMFMIYIQTTTQFVQGAVTVPPSYIIPFCPRLNPAEVRAHFAVWVTNRGLATLHAAKFGFELVPFSEDMLGMDMVEEESNDWIALSCSMQLIVRNTAQTADLPLVLPGDMVTDATTEYTTRPVYFRGDPSYIYRAMQWFCVKGVNNTHGGVFLAEVANVSEQFSGKKCAYNSSTWQAMTLGNSATHRLPGVKVDYQITRAGIATVSLTIMHADFVNTKGMAYGYVRSRAIQDAFAERLFEEALFNDIPRGI